MNKLKFILIALFLIPMVMQGQTATEIVKKSDEKIRGISNYTVMTIKIVRPTWEREMKMRAWSLGTDYSMIIIDLPKRDKGTVF